MKGLALLDEKHRKLKASKTYGVAEDDPRTIGGERE